MSNHENPQLSLLADTTPEQRHAATATVLARVDSGTLTHAGAREVLEMLGVVDGEAGPTARRTVVE